MQHVPRRKVIPTRPELLVQMRSLAIDQAMPICDATVARTLIPQPRWPISWLDRVVFKRWMVKRP